MVHAGPCLAAPASLRAALSVRGHVQGIQDDVNAFITCLTTCSTRYGVTVGSCLAGTQDCSETMRKGLKCWCDCKVPRQLNPDVRVFQLHSRSLTTCLSIAS